MLGRALPRAARRSGAWDRPPVGGVPELRDWFASDIGGGLGRHDILICGAGQSALATTLRALGQPGDPVLIESPTYPGTIAAAHAAGLRTIPVPLDNEGLRTDYTVLHAIASWVSDVPDSWCGPLYRSADPKAAATTPPSKSTIRRVLTGADTQALDAAIGTWLLGQAEASEPDKVPGTPEGDDGEQAPLVTWSADGKALRGAKGADGAGGGTGQDPGGL